MRAAMPTVSRYVHVDWPRAHMRTAITHEAKAPNGLTAHAHAHLCAEWAVAVREGLTTHAHAHAHTHL